jgi:hypothetical protein
MEVLWANKIAHDSVPGLLSMSCSEAFIGTRESCPGCPCLRALRTGRIERQVMHHTEAQGAPGGESFWDTIGVPIRNDEGEITSVLEIARNITEIKQTERALEQALDRAQAASRAKSAFLANMSHELRTPLNPVIGFTDLLLSDDDLSSEQRECLELVNRRGHDLLQLLNDILDIARIEAERMVITPEPTDLGVLLGDVVELFCHPLEGKAVTIRTSMADRVPTTVFVDPLRLRQVLINLVGNAVKFTEQGYIDIGVDILEEEALDNGERGGLRLQFEVRDTGIGISEEHQAVIFSTFTQADDSFTREYGGAGLGLAICRRLTQLMGGDIQVVSKPGKGSVFTFFIQTKSCSEAIASLDSLNDDALVLPKGFTVLLAEDDPASKVLTERLLTRAGGQCECVRSGQQAVKACREKTYDAVLMDIKMPDMDGLTATRLIRAQERAGNRHMPIIAMTAFAFEEDRRACLVAGMDAVLTKPVSASALREQLAQWIALSSGEAGS